MFRNKPVVVGLTMLLALVSTAAYAADQITSVKTKQVELFDMPDDAKPGRKIDPSGLPWIIKDEKNSFFKVAVGGKDVWVDSMQVTVSRDAKSDCPPKVALQNGIAPEKVAGAPGAAATRCR